jgi:hypothetical protein
VSGDGGGGQPVRVFISYAQGDAGHEGLVRELWVFLPPPRPPGRAGLDAAAAAGDLAAARAAYQAGLNIFVRLAAADPANTGWQRDLEGIRLKISDLDG